MQCTSTSKRNGAFSILTDVKDACSRVRCLEFARIRLSWRRISSRNDETSNAMPLLLYPSIAVTERLDLILVYLLYSITRRGDPLTVSECTHWRNPPHIEKRSRVSLLDSLLHIYTDYPLRNKLLLNSC